jgi:hypothetical protein
MEREENIERSGDGGRREYREVRRWREKREKSGDGERREYREVRRWREKRI